MKPISDKIQQLLLNRLPVMLLYLAPEGRIVRHVGNLLNLTPAGLDGQSIDDWFPRCSELLRSDPGASAPFEYLLLQLEAPFFRSFDAYLVPEPEGEVSHVLLLAEKTQEVIQREKFEHLFQHAGQPMLLLDASGLTDCNPAAVTMLGGSNRQEVLACGHVAVFSPPSQPDGSASVEKFMQLLGQARIKGLHRFDWMLQRLSGELVPTEISLLQLPHQPLVLCMIQDLTARTALIAVWENMEARRDAERKLRENDFLFRDIAQNVPGLIYQRRETPEGEVSYPFVSQSSLSEVESGDGSLMPEDLQQLQLHPDDEASYSDTLAASRASLLPWTWQGRLYSHRHQRHLWVEAQANPRLEEDGSVLWTGTLFNISGRKRIEDEVRHSRAHLRALLESIQDGIWSLDHNLRLQTFNNRIRVIFSGLGVELEPGLHLEAILHGSGLSENQLERWLGYFQHALQGRFVCTDLQYLREGEKYFLEFSLNPIRVGSEVTGVVTSVRDITHRRRADELLNEQRMRHEKILNFLPLSIYEKDVLGRYTFVNEQTVKLMGQSADAILGHSDRELLAPELAARRMDVDRRLRSGSSPSLIDEEELWSGDELLTLLAGRSLLDPALPGESPLVGYAIDISERKRFEQQLLESTAALEEAQRMARLGSFRLQWPSRKLEVSAHLRMLLELSDEHHGEALWAIIHPDDVEMVRTVWHRQLERCEGFELDYRVLLPRSGQPLHVSVRTRMIPDAEGKVREIVGTLQDVSERKRIEAELREASLAKSAFLASMSHEIRTPLNAVIGFSELLERRISDPKLQTYLQAIKAGGRSLMTLINDILDLSKIEAGKLDIVWAPVAVQPLFDEMEQIFIHAVAERGLELAFKLDAGLPGQLVLDEARLRQILFNLIGNALKFTAAGHVHVCVHAEPQSESLVDLVVAVEDTGIGVAPEARELIFESFRQQDGQSTRKYGGTGLGLAISRRLAEMMHGEIGLISEVGQGSTFTLRLRGVAIANAPPAEAAQAEAVQAAPELPAPTGGTGPLAPIEIPAPLEARHEILAIFERDIIPIYEATRKNKNFRLIHQLAGELNALGLNYRLDFLQEFGTRLELSAEQFDVTGMNTTLNAFPALVEQIRLSDNTE